MNVPTFELLSLKPSPYSRRVVWSLHLLGVKYRSAQYSSIAGEPALRWRLGRWNPYNPATVPIAFIATSTGKEMILENGVDIVEWADQRKSNKNPISLVPLGQRSNVLKYCRLSDDFQNFDRSMFLKALAHDPPSVLRAVAGDGPPDMVMHVIGAVIGCYMRTKYCSTLQASVCEIQTKAKALEKEIITKQQEMPGRLCYLVDDKLSMADIFMSVATCGGVMDRSKPMTESQKTLENAIVMQGFSIKEECPVLYKWAVEISERHGAPYSLFEDPPS